MSSECDVYRSTYLSHYELIRDLHAAQSHIRPMVSSTSTINTTPKNATATMVATQAFKSARHSPDYGNGCVELKLFDDKRVLAAYRLDGTLRLFEASATPTTITNTTTSATTMTTTTTTTDNHDYDYCYY